MLNYKREIFRINIRHQKHQQIFLQKRIFLQIEYEHSFEQLIDAINNTQIISLRNLTKLNALLLNFSKKKLTIEQNQQIENQAQNLMVSLTNYLVQNNNNLTKEILILLVNLTQMSEKITTIFLRNYQSYCNLIQILSSLIQNRIEVIATLELLMNIWANSNCHQKQDQNLIEIINLFLDFCISIKDNNKILLICKCYKNYLQSISEENNFDYKYLINIIRKLLQYGIQENVDFLEELLETYSSIVQLFNYDFIIPDLDMILNLLDQCQRKPELIEIVTRIISYLSINEPDNFYEKLIFSVIQFSKNIMRSSLNEQIPYILNLCSIIFHQQCEKNYNLLQPFYNDNVIITEIIRFQEDCFPRKIRETSIRSIKILIENSNENQIQLLIFGGVQFRLKDVLNDFSLNSSSILFALISIKNLIKIQGNIIQFLEFENLIQLTKSKNKEIQKITNEIILYIDNHNI
ncbi:unnamed protein product [Paramecium sonneborni]|uniref:Uncharacterized protein n=1 Tax=Paramecium sonneborni TaxID=65129 RepID=A0A8S1MST0_9CILI|nr:unnamed protein product [Paramecium sonneborni]